MPPPFGRGPGLPPAGMRGAVPGTPGVPDGRPDEFVLPGPWYRIQAIPVPQRDASAEWDFVSVLPAALAAATRPASRMAEGARITKPP